MTPLDQRSIDARKQALNMAIATHEGQHAGPRTMLATAKEYFDFMTGAEGDAPAADLPQVVAFPPPSGMPIDPIGGVTVTDMGVTELQEMRRQQLLELDIVAKAIKAHGAVPC